MKNAELFDDYINGELTDNELMDFEIQLNSNPVFAKAFAEHKAFIGSLNSHNKRTELKAKLKAIHTEAFGNEAKIIAIDKKEKAKQFGRTAMIAASTALVVMMGAIALVNSGVQKNTQQITDLSHSIQATTEGIIEGIKEGSQKSIVIPANIEGSAFALNNEGFMITSLHIVKGSDSVFVQNSQVARTVAKVVYTDPSLDLAILQLQNKDICKEWQVPFSFSSKSSEIGEKVFTLGYPRKDMVYGEGALSSLSGFSNDTSMYQISIPVNPGNSGGPLLDEQGNIIGVIRGKVTNAEATGFAIKSADILRSIQLNDSIHLNNPRKSALKGLKRTEQIKKINPYVFNVLVY